MTEKSATYSKELRDPATRITVIDYETTGLDARNDRVVEVGWCDVAWDDRNSIFMPFGPGSMLCNPRIPIPAVSKAVHHITESMIENSPVFDGACNTIFKDRDLLVAHNAEFEAAFTSAADYAKGIPWLCTLRLARHLYPHAPGFSNEVLRYHLGFENVPGDPHRAGHDAHVTALILCHMFNVSGADIGHTVASLVEYAESPVLLTGKCGFGKHKDLLWTDVPHEYVRWMRKQGQRSEDNEGGWDRDVWFTVCSLLDGARQ